MKRLTISALALAATFLTAPANAQFEDASIRLFHVADSNGDERLTLAEFRVFIQAMAAEGARLPNRIRTFGAYGVAFRRIDTNGDGLASPEELYAAEAGT